MPAATAWPRRSLARKAVGAARWCAGRPLVRQLVPFLPIIAAWWAAAASGAYPRAFLPGPGDVAAAFGRLLYEGILPAYLHDSLVRLAWGAAAGIAVGVPLGLLVGLNRYCYRFFWPLVIFFQAIGDIAWLPILLVWFGFSLTTMTFVIAYTVMFPLIFHSALGVRLIATDLLRAAACLGATPWRTLVEVFVPGALPNMLTGLRNGLGYGWRALVAAEIIVGTSGIGFMMFDARRSGSATEMILGMIVLGMLWYAVDGWVLVPLERMTVQRWGLVTRSD